MTVAFSIKERGKRPGWRASDYFVDRSMIVEVSIGKEQAMSGAVCLLAHSWEQIGSRFFSNVSKDTVNRRLRKLVDVDLIKRTTAYVGRRAISGYSLTQGGLAKVTPTLPYGVKTKATRSKCSLHDIALNDIRKVFESKRTVQGYYTENVLQARTDLQANEWFQPFIELNSDAMAEVDSKVGTLHLAIELDTTHKSHRSYRRKLNAYYGRRRIDGVLYICADEYILQTLCELDSEAAEQHHSDHKLYFALLADVTGAEGKLTFTNASKDIFCVR